MHTYGNKVWIAAVILCVGVTVSQFRANAAPQNNDNNETPFPLELQPPLVDNLDDAIDSYGNPITSSQPIETPDGRKVIIAQGVQFEIPNYASGITEIKKPIENLLPPFIDTNSGLSQNDAYFRLETDHSAPQLEYTLPDWLADFNDPDVGPGVPYTPSNDASSLKVLSWDLVPPNKEDPLALSTNFGTIQRNTFPVTLPTKQTFVINKGVQMTTTTTSTTRRPTRIPMMTTTTTTTTTIRSPVTTTTEVITTSKNFSSEIFELPGGNSEVLPSWLEGFDDPELSIAVPFEIPEDNNEYNHTLPRNLLPPLEPFEDLKILSVSGFLPNQVPPITTTTTATFNTTTPSPINTSSIQSHLSTFKPFHLTTKTTSNIPTTTHHAITESPVSARIPHFTLKSSAQPSGFTPRHFMTTQPVVKPTFQPVVKPTFQPVLYTKLNPFFNSSSDQNRFDSFYKSTKTTEAPTKNEFVFGSVTTPSWLTGISSVSPGKGVPFSIPENREPHKIFNGILPSKSQVAEDGVTIQKSISSQLSALSFIHNSIPSQSIIPTNQAFTFTSTPLPEPSRIFTPPVVVLSDKDDNENTDGIVQSQTIPIKSNNFPEATEPTTKPTSKITFNKSDQGKVISNSIFEPGHLVTKPTFEVTQPATPNGLFTTSTIGSSYPSLSSTTGTIFSDKYTGGFGGAPGFLGGQSRPGYAIQPDGSIRDPDHTLRPAGLKASLEMNLQSRIDLLRLPNAPTAITEHGQTRVYKGSFGGPPGVLVPFDNIKSA